MRKDYEKISDEILKVDWITDLARMNVDAAWKTFEDKIATLIQKYMPKRIPRKVKRNNWITKETVKMIRTRGKNWHFIDAHQRMRTMSNIKGYVTK